MTRTNESMHEKNDTINNKNIILKNASRQYFQTLLENLFAFRIDNYNNYIEIIKVSINLVLKRFVLVFKNKISIKWDQRVC